MPRKKPPIPPAPHFPSKEEVLRFIEESPSPPSRREIARAFNLKKKDGDALKHLLKSLKSAGKYSRRGKPPAKEKSTYRLPPVTIVTITAINEEGEAVATPADWPDKRRQPPHIVISNYHSQAAAAVGEKLLVKLTAQGKYGYIASVLRVLHEAKEERVVGLFVRQGESGMVEPSSRKDKNRYTIGKEDTLGAEHGEVVVAKVIVQPTPRMGLRQAEIIERVGKIDNPRSASLIAIAANNIPLAFSAEAMQQAAEAKPPVAKDREDLRAIPLVTIDGEDARDFDDAVFAEPDKSKANPNGWHIIVAIADVAHYVRYDDALDKDAFLRGNSVYFPDRVVPMLPEALSNGLCSLKPDEDRYCLAVHLYIDAQGETIRHQFVRGIMRSHARLTYEKAQHIHDSKEDKKLYETIIKPLYGAYHSLNKNREIRGTLDLNLPEYKVKLNEAGHVVSIAARPRLDSHRLIEEFMICANVAAARTIEKAGYAAIFRVHETPDTEKIEELREWLDYMGYGLSKGDGLKAQHFNKVLQKAEGKPESQIISTAILRSQMQAYYAHKNVGHFGLALTHYCHFTSPIRRYSDLIVHRALISILALKGKTGDGLSAEQAARLPAIAEHISMTERRAMLAERDANDRYTVAYMTDKIGREFEGFIANLNSFGLFVALLETGAQGFIPIATLGNDFYQFEKGSNSLLGRRSGNRFTIGQRVLIKVRETNPLTGSLLFELRGADGLSAESLQDSGNRHFKGGKHRSRFKHSGKKPRRR